MGAVLYLGIGPFSINPAFHRGLAPKTVILLIFAQGSIADSPPAEVAKFYYPFLSVSVQVCGIEGFAEANKQS